MNTTTKLTALAVVGILAVGLSGCATTNPLAEAERTCGGSGTSLLDDGRSLTFNMEGDEPDSGLGTLATGACLLSELDVPDSVVAKMDATRALDGAQSDTFGGYEITWSYHPDQGLDFIIERAA